MNNSKDTEMMRVFVEETEKDLLPQRFPADALVDAIVSLPEGWKEGCGSQDIEIDVNVNKEEIFLALKDFASRNGFIVNDDNYQAWPNRIVIVVQCKREAVAELIVQCLESFQLRNIVRLVSVDVESKFYSPARTEVESFL